MIEVVTVTFNNYAGLLATAASVLEQNRSIVRWIVVDGGSNDGSLEFLQAFSRKNPEIRVDYISEPDSGLYDAMNKGIARLSCDGYAIFMNAGDVFADTGVCDYFLDRAKANSMPAMLVGNSIRVKKGGKIYHKKSKPTKHIKIGMFCEHQALFVRANLLTRFNYDLRYSYKV